MVHSTKHPAFSFRRAMARQGGYTIMQTAAVVVLAGLLVAVAAPIYRNWQANALTERTASNLDVVMDAISAFRVQNGRYPCPAPVNVARTDPTYGTETDCADTASVAANSFSATAGYYVESGVTTRIRRGAVPFRDLNLPELLSEDGYHNRLQYAVTESQAVLATYTRTGGSVFVGDNGTPRVAVTSAPAQFVVFSSGQDKAGAYTHEGKLAIPCPTIGLDAFNCNFADNDGYRFGQAAKVAGAGHFDDMIRISSSAGEPLWIATGATGEDVRDTGLASAMGIGGQPTSTVVRLDVADNMRAQASVRSEKICEKDGSACFGAEKIAEPLGVAEMKCPKPSDPPGFIFAHKIANGEIECRPYAAYTCPANTVLVGMNGAGVPVCQPLPAPPPVCPVTNPACFTVVIPPTVNGVCGPANGVATMVAPAPASLCAVGTAVGFNGSGPWQWSCSGTGLGATANCQAPLPAAAVTGVCGPANGVAVSLAPRDPVALCSVGTPSAVVGSGPWAWTCTAASGSVPCTAPLSATARVCSIVGTPYHQKIFKNGDVVEEHIVNISSTGSIDVYGLTAACPPLVVNNHPFYIEMLDNATGVSLATQPSSYVAPTPSNPSCPGWSVAEATRSFSPLSAGSYKLRLISQAPIPCVDIFGCSAMLTSYVCQGTAVSGPDPFGFIDVNGAAVSTVITSNTVTLTGTFTNLTATCGPNCTGISINGAAFVAGPVMGVNTGDTIAIRQISASSPGIPTSASVSLGSTVSRTWEVLTGGICPVNSCLCSTGYNLRF